MSEVVMPQMGESIAEGTIVRWIKKVGDRVERDEPLFEISTDKVDAEIPSPSAGVLVEIRAKEGETVPVDSVVAVIGEAGAAVAATPAPAAKAEAPAPVPVAPAPPVPPIAPVAPAPVAAAPPLTPAPIPSPIPAAVERPRPCQEARRRGSGRSRRRWSAGSQRNTAWTCHACREPDSAAASQRTTSSAT